MQFDIITIFPKIFDSYFNETILKRARGKGLIKIKIHNLRAYTTDRHKTVDDRPYGGGPGMIFKIEPIFKALRVLKNSKVSTLAKTLTSRQIPNSQTILLDPRGKQFDQKIAKRLSRLNRLILICGRYEGIDARVDKLVDEKISIGPYILSGGELAAAVIVEATSRLIPGVLGKKESLTEETFSLSASKLEYPQYTRPEVFVVKTPQGKIKEWRVPKVLLSGDHQKISRWRQKQTKIRRR